MSTIDRIVEWADSLPGWQSDAVRRLLTQEGLNPEDEREILRMLKESEDLCDPEHKAPAPIPLGHQHLPTSRTMTKLVLKRMTDVKNVNALVADQKILFGHEGITAIYGENATGKSGYARVLKRACRTRDSQEKIHPNILGHGPESAASAVFGVSIDGIDKNVTWIDREEKPNDLADVAVFDSKCARIILNERNEPTYLPYGASVFEDLCALMDHLRQRLQSERPEIAPLVLDDVPPSTEAGRLIASPCASTSASQIEAAAAWSKLEEESLARLDRQIAVAEGKDPQAQIRALRRLKGRVETLANDVGDIDAALSTVSEQRIKLAIERAQTTQDAARRLAQHLSDEPLTDVGGDPWRTLYEAAKRYSVQVAYPGRGFPVTDDEALCVLCMQPISEEAKQRFSRFRDFMEGDIQRQLQESQLAVAQESKKLQDADFAPLQRAPDLLDEIRERNALLAESVDRYLRSVTPRATSFGDALRNQQFEAAPPLAASPESQLAALATDLASEADQLERATKPEELEKLKKEHSEQKAWKALGAHKPKVLEYLGRLKTAAKYDACVRATHTKHISDKGRAIVAEARTPELLERLQHELQELGAEHIPLNLEASASRGETLHKLVLKDAVLPAKTDLSDILSEGEQCVVAIGGFLAELAVVGHAGPIVLDDPVSSLDHRFRGRIARRLAREGAHRQVVVFTHDIAFLLELKAETTELENVKWAAGTVLSLAGTAGHCVSGEPWHAKSVKERLVYLHDHLGEFRVSYNVHQATYNQKAAEFYGLLRDTWERAVEEEVLYGVVRSHGAEVQTMRLKSVEVTTDDYRTIHLEMAKCSRWMTGHRTPAAADANRPPPEELDKDLESLKQFAKEVRRRHDKLRKEREAALEPDTPSVG